MEAQVVIYTKDDGIKELIMCVLVSMYMCIRVHHVRIGIYVHVYTRIYLHQCDCHAPVISLVSV